MKLDLGCGARKQPGFLGMDILPLAGVDIVGDLNKKLPFPEDAAEFIMVSRTLPYVHDLFAVLAEVYRVYMHKAVVCILAPYARSYHHISNPHIRHKFDEHTPRYLTSAFFQPPLGQKCPDIIHYPGLKPQNRLRSSQMVTFICLQCHVEEEIPKQVVRQLDRMDDGDRAVPRTGTACCRSGRDGAYNEMPHNEELS